MRDFIIGIISGVVLSQLAGIILYFLQKNGAKIISSDENPYKSYIPVFSPHSPHSPHLEFKEKGSVIEPKDDASLARQELLDRNDALGKDTPIEDL